MFPFLPCLPLPGFCSPPETPRHMKGVAEESGVVCAFFFFQQGLEILSHCFVNWTGRLPFYLWQLNNGVKSGKTRDKKLTSLYRLSSCTELCTVLIPRFERGRELCWQLLGLWPACFLIFPNERTLCFMNVDVPNKQTTIKPRCK